MWARVIAAAGVLLATLAVQVPAAQATTRHEFFGTHAADRMRGTGSADLLGSRGGDDIVRPGRGTDIVRGGAGDDWIYLTNDGAVDRIHCGGGRDVVVWRFDVDQHDIIDANCEAMIA